jgi:hypothetical protein
MTCFLLENISSEKSGLLGIKRGDFLSLVIATGPIMVGESG